jgi:hypothetical protein
VVTADIDGNGTPDIVTSEQEQAPFRRVSVFHNDGAGNFTEQILSNANGHNTEIGKPIPNGPWPILNAPHGYYYAPNPVEIYRRRCHDAGLNLND